MRLFAETIPDGLIPYSIRHRDDDDSVPATIEARVVANYFGTLIVNAPLDFGGSDHIAIIDWSFDDTSDNCSQGSREYLRATR